MALRHPFRAAMLSLGCASICVLAGCTPIDETRTQVFGDLHPPQLQDLAMEGPHLIVARFNETTSISPESVHLTPDLGELSVTTEGQEVHLRTDRPATVGAVYAVQARATDESGNSLTFMLTVTGFNPDPATLRINEFTPQGSGNNPDMVELLVTEGGNLGGAVFYAGSPGENDGSLTFPAMEVATGDFVLVHLKPEQTAEEVDETTDPGASGGRNAHPEAWDFWMAEPTGLSGNNGAVSVYAYQDGPLLDAVIYSNRSHDPEARYGSFGTASAEEMIREVVADGGWKIAGDTARPEDAVDPEDSTSTRSISRSSTGVDTDHRRDWHITPTSGSTFGEPNTDERYEG